MRRGQRPYGPHKVDLDLWRERCERYRREGVSPVFWPGAAEAFWFLLQAFDAREVRGE